MPEIIGASGQPETANRKEIVSIPVDKIRPSPYQVRKYFDQEKLKALGQSMKEEGQLEPVLVRDKGDFYELVFGERRWRGAQLVGITNLDAVVIKTVSEAEAAAKGLLENLQREELDPLEEAEGFSGLYKLDPNYWT